MTVRDDRSVRSAPNDRSDLSVRHGQNVEQEGNARSALDVPNVEQGAHLTALVNDVRPVPQVVPVNDPVAVGQLARGLAGAPRGMPSHYFRFEAIHCLAAMPYWRRFAPRAVPCPISGLPTV